MTSSLNYCGLDQYAKQIANIIHARVLHLTNPFEISFKIATLQPGKSVEEIVKTLDPILAHQHHVPIHERPSVILHKMILDLDEVDTETIEDEILACYVDLYPNTVAPGWKRVLGVLLVRGTAFSLQIPTATAYQDSEGRRVIDVFATKIRADEDPRSWVEGAPNWTRLGSNSAAAVKKDLISISESVRRIHAGIKFTSSDDIKADRLKIKIVPSLEQAARYLLEPSPLAIQYAYWELQMALEHAFKTREQQRHKIFTKDKKGHDLRFLYQRMGGTDQKFIDDLMSIVPNHTQAAALRYGDGNRSDRLECYKAYKKSLEAIVWAVGTFDKWWPLHAGKHS